MSREALLRFALIAFGAVFCLVYPLAIVWPSGWAWHEGAPAEFAVLHDDSRRLRDVGHFPDPRGVRPSREPIAHLFHHRLKRRARRDYGDPILWSWPAPRASAGRCSCTNFGRCCAWSVDAREGRKLKRHELLKRRLAAYKDRPGDATFNVRFGS